MLILVYAELIIYAREKMSIDFKMSPDIVMAPSTDLGDHWSKVARERIHSKGNDIRSRGFFYRDTDESYFK